VPKPAAPGPIARAALPRPLTVTVLSVLWLLAGAVYGAVGLGLAIFGSGGASGLATGAGGVLLALLSGVVGLGLWTRAPWARLLQLVLAGIGIFTCVFTLPALAIIAYMLRPEIQPHFAGARILSGEELDRAKAKTPEMAFALGIVGTLVFSVLLAGVTAYVGRTLWGKARGPVPETTAPPLAAPGRN
jgi:cbb3-type cytochrome oxidase subunit 3